MIFKRLSIDSCFWVSVWAQVHFLLHPLQTCAGPVLVTSVSICSLICALVLLIQRALFPWHPPFPLALIFFLTPLLWGSWSTGNLHILEKGKASDSFQQPRATPVHMTLIHHSLRKTVRMILYITASGKLSNLSAQSYFFFLTFYCMLEVI